MAVRTQRVVVRRFGLVNYDSSWRAMRDFTASRTADTPDELWLLQHSPVFTLGLKHRNARSADLHGVPLVHSDRGGDVTYHGPGQVVAYLLADLARLKLGIKALVHGLEQAVIDLLAGLEIPGDRRHGAPGVYVDHKKIAALGLRVRRGCSYHGLALNVNMDLTPFSWIDPCGYKGLEVTQLADFDVQATTDEVAGALSGYLLDRVGYNSPAVRTLPRLNPSGTGIYEK